VEKIIKPNFINDNYRIRFSGTAEISEPLNTDEEFSVAIERMNCKDVTMRPNEDGTETYTYKLTPTSHASIISREKVIILPKTHRKRLYDCVGGCGGLLMRQEWTSKSFWRNAFGALTGITQ